MRVNTVAMLLVVVSALLAGCVGGSDPDPSDDDDFEARTSEDLGSVTGRILTEELTDVEGARISLVEDDELVAETTSRERGQYTLNDVEPGDYRLQITAPCCREHVQGVSVQAGEVTDVDVQLVLFTAEDLQTPWIDKSGEWSGFISCAAGIAVNAVNPCIYDPSNDHTETFTVKPGIQALVASMDWDPVGGASGESFRLRFEEAGCGGSGGCTYGASEGAPPIFMHADEEYSQGGPTAWSKVEEDYDVYWRVFPSWDPGVAYQQEFTVLWHVFYYQDAPEDYDPRPDA